LQDTICAKREPRGSPHPEARNEASDRPGWSQYHGMIYRRTFPQYAVFYMTERASGSIAR